MADTIYRVLTVYDVDTRAAKSEIGSLAIVADHALHLLERGKELVGSLIELRSEAENATIALAGLMSAGDFPGAKNFQTSMGMSAEIIKQMRKDARDLPGEFQDLENIFQRGLLGGSQAGKSVNEVESMSAKLMAVTKALGISSEFAGREFAEMMEGRASSRVALFAKLKNLMGDSDMTAAKFNALSAPEKWERIAKALASFGPMIDEYSKTWDAVSSTTTDYLKNIVRIGGAGAFERLKQVLIDVNGWYERNEEAIMRVAGAIFNGIGNAIGVVVGFTREAVGVVYDFLEALGLTDRGTEKVESLGTALGTAVVVLGLVKAGTVAWEIAQWALNTALFANPIGLIILAVVALAAAIVDLLSKMKDLRDQWAIFTNTTLRGLSKAGVVTPALAAATTDEQADAEVNQAIQNIKDRQRYLKDTYGDDGFMARVKDMLGVGGAPALAHSRAGSHARDIAGGIGIRALLDAHKKAAPTANMNVHVTINQNINDSEDPARVLRTTKLAIRDSLERPVQTFVAGVYR